MLTVKDLFSSYGAAEVLHGVDLAAKKGESLYIAGPNGCGKTTLLKCMAGLQPFRGSVTIAEKEVRSYRRRDLARRVGLMTQITETYFPYTVYDTAALGRYAHLRSPLGAFTEADRAAVNQCLERVGLLPLAQKRISELSGGQLQRVYLARLFAQDPDIILLDEPTNHLDLKYQIELLEFVTDWSRREKKTVIGVLHDLNLVCAYAQRAILMKNGRVFARGKPREALSDENLRICYGTDIAGWMRRSLGNWAYGRDRDSP